MSPTTRSIPLASQLRAGDVLLPALLALLALLPPEARGESQAGVAALLALTALSTCRRAGPGVLTVLGLGLVALPWLVLAATAPGRVAEAWATVVLAVVAGTYAARLPRAEGSARRLGATLAIVGTLAAAHGVYQVTVGLDDVARAIESGAEVSDRAIALERARAGRAFAAFPTPAALGGFLVLALPATVGGALERRGRARAAWLAAAALQASGLVATQSATAAAALVGALLVLGLVDARARRAVLAAASVAALLCAVVVALRGAEVLDLGRPDSPWRLRSANVRIAAAMVADHPWIGVGPGGYGEAYPQYRRAGDNEAQHAHNLPLELVAEWGLPLGLLLTAWFAAAFAGPLLGRPTVEGTWCRGVAVGLTALVLQSLADFTAFLPSLLWSAALLRGALPRAAPRIETTGARMRAAVALAAVLLAAGVSALGGLAGEQRRAARNSQSAGQRSDAVRRSERAVRLAPWNADGWLFLGQARIAVGETEPARLTPVAERAIALAPTRPAARLLRARLRLAGGDLPGAYADAVEAARLYPSSASYARTRDELAARFRAAAPAGGTRP